MHSKLSYVAKPGLSPYLYETVPRRLEALARENPDREAFIFYDIHKKRSSLTRKELWDKSLNVANHLVTLGLEKGSPVAFCMANSLEMLVLTMGVTIAGGIAFYFNSHLKDGSDMIETMNFLKGEMLVMDADYGDDNWNILQKLWPAGQTSCSTVPSLKNIIFNGKGNEREYANRINTEELTDKECTIAVEHAEVFPEDTLAYFCTSGSTGKPKIVIYTHFCILNWTDASSKVFEIHTDSVFFCDRTFSWVVGYPRTYLLEGTKRLFVDTRMSLGGKHVTDICEIIEKEMCDIVFLPGYLAVDISQDEVMSRKLRNVRTIITAGERVCKTLVTELMAKVCNRVIVFYGATEAGAVSYFFNESSDEYEDGIIGVPFDGVEIKIINETGNVVPYGCSGELVVRCVWRCAGYQSMPSVFHKSLDDSGWFHTGDIAHFREDGNLVVSGRYQERLSIGTMKVFPWSVEKALRRCHGVMNVFAVGVPDVRLNQVICACVQPKPDVALSEEDVSKYCQQTFLDQSTAMGTSLKPRYHLVLDAVPLTPSGKIDRRRIAAIAKERLGL